MSRFAKIAVLVGLFFGFMLLLTYISPAINQYAGGLARGSHLPLWLVGLAAPILFGFKKLGDLLRGIFGESDTEKGIRESNEAIRLKLAQIEGDVRRLDEWRTRETESRIGRINGWEQDVSAMRGREAALDNEIAGLLERDDQARGTGQSLQDEIAELQATVADLRAAMTEENP